MKIFGRLEQALVSHEEHGEFAADSEGGFEVPQELGEALLQVHVNGKPAFETDGQRSIRLVAEADEANRDPKALYELVQQMANTLVSQGVPVPPVPVPTPAPAEPPVQQQQPDVPVAKADATAPQAEPEDVTPAPADKDASAAPEDTEDLIGSTK